MRHSTDPHAVRAALSTMRHALADAPLALFALNREGRILLVEGSDCDRLGLTAAGCIGQDARVVFQDHPAMLDALRRAVDGVAAQAVIAINAAAYEVLLRPQMTGAGAITGVVGVAIDVTAWVHLERDLRRRATHDALTGLPNKALFQDRLTQAIHRATRANDSCAVVLLDLDGFKEVNDTYGHACGDALLIEVASRLNGVIRASDTVARLGGDEFGCVLPATDGVGAGRLLMQMRAALATPFVGAGGVARVGISGGLAVFPLDETDTASLLLHADRALYQAKGRSLAPNARAHRRGRRGRLRRDQSARLEAGRG